MYFHLEEPGEPKPPAKRTKKQNLPVSKLSLRRSLRVGGLPPSPEPQPAAMDKAAPCDIDLHSSPEVELGAPSTI